MLINRIKAATIRGIAGMRLQQRFLANCEQSSRTLLFHSIFGERESRDRGRERIKRMCDWICCNYVPLSHADYLTCMEEHNFPENALFVTFDDARKRILDAVDIFKTFRIPLTIFVAIGWTDSVEVATAPSTLPRLLHCLENYQGRPQEVLLPGSGRLWVGTGNRDAEADLILSMASQDEHFVGHVWEQLGSEFRSGKTIAEVCNWKDLNDLAAQGIGLGSHAISHCRLRGKSPQRIQYEVLESRRILEDRIGQCHMFAYPYGTWQDYDDRITFEIEAAGYRCAFLTHAGFGQEPNPYLLPRIDIPDQELSDRLFQALVQGGQIPLIRLKNFLTGRSRS